MGQVVKEDGATAGRKVKIGMSTMNKHKRRSYKKYRGQGKRWYKNLKHKLLHQD